MRRGGSGSGVSGAGAERGGLRGAGAAGWAVAIDPVRVGAASSTNAGTGAETSAGLHRRWSIGMGRRNRSGSRRSRVLERRLGPEAVVDEDARGKRREKRYGSDERRFHGHGQTVSSILPRKTPNHAFHAGSKWMIR